MIKPSHTSRCLAFGPLALGVLVACTPPPSQVKVDDLNRQIAALRAQNTEYTRKIEELENQVFVLADRAESDRVVEQRVASPHLPRVTLKPGQPLADADGGETIVGTSYGDDDTVEYAGEAAKPSKTRPVLRLIGNGGGVAVEDPAAPMPRRLAVTPPAPPVRKPMAVTSTEARKVSVNAPDHNAVQVYKQSLDHLKSGRHADAAAGFRDFLRRFGQHEYADNAQYWLAECYYDLKDFVTAVAEFRKVIEGYPNGNKAPDAMLKVGFAYLSLGNEPAGRSTLAELVRSYPAHSAAALAGDKLNELGDSARDAALAGSSGAKGEM